MSQQISANKIPYTEIDEVSFEFDPSVMEVDFNHFEMTEPTTALASNNTIQLVKRDIPSNDFIQSAEKITAPPPERLGQKLYIDGSDYPLEALGDVLSAIAIDLHEVIKAPMGLCGQSVLMAGALVAQGIKNVEMDGRTYPLSLFGLTIGESGERKTAVDKFVMHPIKAFEKEAGEKYSEDVAEYKGSIEAYKQAESNLKTQLKSDKKTDPEAIKKEMAKMGDKPIPPLKPTMTGQDVTIEGLIKHLRYAQPTMGIFTDEGGVFFGGHSMAQEKALKTITQYSKAWDGSELDMMRSDSEVGAFRLYNRRVSMHLMIQPIVAKGVFNDPLLVQQGFIPRFLICNPDSTMGTRTYSDANITHRAGYKRYFARLKSMLDDGLHVGKDGGLDLVAITLVRSAKDHWIKFHDEVEARLNKEGEYRHASGTASKIAEQALRIAGVLTVIKDGNKAKYVADTEIKAGIELARYSLNQLLNMIEKSQITASEENARLLLNWIAQNRFINVYGGLQASSRPRAVRKKADYEKAMQVLTEYGYVEPLSELVLDNVNRKDVYKVLHHCEP